MKTKKYRVIYQYVMQGEMEVEAKNISQAKTSFQYQDGFGETESIVSGSVKHIKVEIL